MRHSRPLQQLTAAALTRVRPLGAVRYLADFGPLEARRVDIGQTGAESWRCWPTPRGNEFCVIRPKETLTR